MYLVLVAVLAWAAAIKLGLDWWKVRRAKQEPPD